MTKVNKAVAIIGIIFGIGAIIMGICILKMDCGNWQDSTVSFGGDFYTYSYKATARAANNVLEMAKILQRGLAYLLLTLGAFESIYFGNLTLNAFTEPKALNPQISENNTSEISQEELLGRGMEETT